MNLIVHTLVPIHIGGGEVLKLSPYADYVVDKDVVNYIDIDRLLDTLSQEKIDKYIELVKRAGRNTNITYGLSKFLKDNKIDYKPFRKEKFLFYSKDEAKEVGNNVREIHGFARSSMGRYIPGSSIKGAIETALLYSYFSQRKQEKEGVYKGLSKPRLSPKYAFSKVFETEYDITKKSPVRNPFRDIQIGDSTPLPTNYFRVTEAKIFHLKRLNLESPLRLEVIIPGNDIKVRFKFTDYAKEKDEFWRFIDKRDYKTMFDYINLFAKDFIEHELKTLETSINKGTEEIGKNYISSVMISYNKLLERIKDSQNEKAYILLGQGTSFFSKTIDSVFSPLEFKTIRERFKKPSLGWKEEGFSNPFPITRKVLSYTNSHLMGWVSLSIEDV